MANRSQALYLRQLYRTRQRLQRRVPNELIDVAGGIENIMSKQPKVYDERFCNHMNTPLLQVVFLIGLLLISSPCSTHSNKNCSKVTFCCGKYVKWACLWTNNAIFRKSRIFSGISEARAKSILHRTKQLLANRAG